MLVRHGDKTLLPAKRTEGKGNKKGLEQHSVLGEMMLKTTR